MLHDDVGLRAALRRRAACAPRWRRAASRSRRCTRARSSTRSRSAATSLRCASTYCRSALLRALISWTPPLPCGPPRRSLRAARAPAILRVDLLGHLRQLGRARLEGADALLGRTRAGCGAARAPSTPPRAASSCSSAASICAATSRCRGLHARQLLQQLVLDAPPIGRLPRPAPAPASGARAGFAGGGAARGEHLGQALLLLGQRRLFLLRRDEPRVRLLDLALEHRELRRRAAAAWPGAR